MVMLYAFKLTFFGWLVNFLYKTGHAQNVTKPNFLFILADDLGFNDIGYHAKAHGSAIRTPFLDKLAKKGVKLENYYVQPVCTPTRGAFLTGRYDIHFGLQHRTIKAGQPVALTNQYELLPQRLKKCGYDTHMVGKWHLGFYKPEFLPWNRGFNTFSGSLAGSTNHFTRKKCFRNTCGYDWWSSPDGHTNDTFGKYSTSLFAEKSIEALKNRHPTKPFFLYLAYQSPHTPLQVPSMYEKRFRHIRNRKRRRYAGMVAALDDSVRRVTNYLKQAGILDNTIIVFSSDNGGSIKHGANNWPLRGSKSTLWEGGIRTVGFVHGKRLGVSNITYDGLMHVTDWFPTFLRAAGCKEANYDNELDGSNQWESISQNTTSPRTEILHGIEPLSKIGSTSSTLFDTSVAAALRSGPWKLITGNISGLVNKPSKHFRPPESKTKYTLRPIRKSGSAGIQLFNIEHDPYEYHDVASQNPEIVQRLLKRLAHYNSTAVPVVYSPCVHNQSDPALHGGYWGPWQKQTNREGIDERPVHPQNVKGKLC